MGTASSKDASWQEASTESLSQLSDDELALRRKPSQEYQSDTSGDEGIVGDKLKRLVRLVDAELPRRLVYCHKPTSPPILIRLPPEILASIVGHLNNSDIKNLRLINQYLLWTVPLRLSRVFLSPNPLNIDVFRDIADHEVFRHGIVEIIYDDAHLPRSEKEAKTPPDPPYRQNRITNKQWFKTERKQNILDIHRRMYPDVIRPRYRKMIKQACAEMSLKDSWKYYQNLIRQQDKVIESGADAEALLYALQRFPRLRRITITPATHGWLYNPLYETPMIRAFPYGFNYPIPRGWPTTHDERGDGPPPEALIWEGNDPDNGVYGEDVRGKWRGLRSVLHVLAQNKQHRIPELVIDANGLNTGLNCCMFEKPCEDYANLVSILRQPGFSHLHLALQIGGEERENFPTFRNGLLRDALGAARELTHIYLRTDAEIDLVHNMASLGQQPLQLLSIFPIHRWPNLQHFGLSNFPVLPTDLISFLAELPPTLCSVELSFLSFPTNCGSYRELLCEMKSSLNWHKRDVRPTIRMAVQQTRPKVITGRAIWIEKEIEEFLYSNGENPFRLGAMSNMVKDGFGISRDTFDADFTRPWLNETDYIALGYHRNIREELRNE